MREARLERYIRDFVLEKTAEKVYLRLDDIISVGHTSKRGSTTLAAFWAKVLQHTDNFPPKRFRYKSREHATRGEQLVVRADDISIAISMATGELTIEGKYVYDWFTKNFKEVLDHYDPQFAQGWSPSPAPAKDLAPTGDTATAEPKDSSALSGSGERFDALAARSVSGERSDALAARIDHMADIYIPGLGNMNVDRLQDVWLGQELQAELDGVSNGGGVRDAMTYIYKLWRSLLNQWFSQSGSQVYLATPELDSERLRDVMDIALRHYGNGVLAALYLPRRCDPVLAAPTSRVKHEALRHYDVRQQVILEYQVLRQVSLLASRCGVSLVAGVREGRAQVLVTSAGFHGATLLTPSLHTAVYLEMDAEDFKQRYIAPIASAAIETAQYH